MMVGAPAHAKEASMQQTEERPSTDWIVTRANAESDEITTYAALTAHGHGPIMAMSFPEPGLECLVCGLSAALDDDLAVTVTCDTEAVRAAKRFAIAQSDPDIPLALIDAHLDDMSDLRAEILASIDAGAGETGEEAAL